MNVTHQRNVDTTFDLAHGPGRVHIRHSHTNDLTSGLLQPQDLRRGGLHILGGSVAHGLDGYSRAAAQCNGSHHDLLAHTLSPIM